MMQSRARRVHRWLLAAALVASDVTAAAEPRGKLVIVIVVDQLRYQDLLWLGGEFGAHGFAGLGDAVPVRYEMALTHTAPGHATIAGVRIPPSYTVPFIPRSAPLRAGILNDGCAPAYCGSLF